MIRVQLISPTKGSLVIRKADPVDINALTCTLKRSTTNDGVVRQVVIDIKFIKAGRSFLKTCFEQTGGPDALVLANIFWLNTNTRQFEPYASGQVNFSNYELNETDLIVDVEQTGFQRTVENSLDLPVDLQTAADVYGKPLSANPAFDLPLHGKLLLKRFSGSTDGEIGADLYDISSDDLDQATWYMHYALDKDVQDELVVAGNKNDSSFIIPSSVYGTLAGLPLDSKRYIRKFLEPGHVTIKNLHIPYKLQFDGGAIANGSVEWRLQWGPTGAEHIVVIGGDAFPLPGVNIFQGSHDLNNYEFDVNTGDELYLYARIFGDTVNGTTGKLLMPATRPSLEYTMTSNFAASTTKASMMYESVKRCVQFATGKEDCFRSDLLGRTDLGYGVDGSGSIIANTSGYNIRKIDKPLVHTLQDLIDTNNALHCVGIGYEVENGIQRLRLEKKEYFYNSNLRALNLGKVYNVRRRLDPNRIWSQFVFGYSSKIDLDQINATDAFNTLRNYIMPVRNSKGKLNVSTEVKADGYQIEYQRRLLGLTADGSLDEDNFIIQCIRDGGSFKAKKDEGYDSITGVIDSATGYNYDISPARCARNWLRYIAGAVIYSQDKTVKFGSGQVNYELATKKTGEAAAIKENDPIDLFGIKPLFKPFIIEFEVQKLRVDDFKELVQKANGYIELQDNFGQTLKGFIDAEVSHNPTTLAANFQLLEMFE